MSEIPRRRRIKLRMRRTGRRIPPRRRQPLLMPGYIAEPLNIWADNFINNINVINNIDHDNIIDDIEQDAKSIIKEEPKKEEIKTHRFYIDCVICTDKFTEEDEVKELPCKHIFHPNCIDKWLETKKQCPTCRMDL